MTEYVGGEFILTADSKGLTIKRNTDGHGCGEFFQWDEIRHLFDAPQKAAHNSDNAKPCFDCVNYKYCYEHSEYCFNYKNYIKKA